jgi:hypothetical protein
MEGHGCPSFLWSVVKWIQWGSLGTLCEQFNVFDDGVEGVGNVPVNQERLWFIAVVVRNGMR